METTTETDYDQLGRLLQLSDLAPTPGEAHGILCGLVCGGARDPERTWLIADEPAHAWVRSTWESQSVDPRLPYTAE